jgi:methionyl-tRNA formyltransferase
VRTVYLGTSEFAAAVLTRLADSPHRPSLVITRPDRPAGRGRRLRPPAVAERARELGLPVVQPDQLHAPQVLEQIAAERPEALIVCAYGVLIKEPLLSDYELVNVHPSLLPRWRGAAPLERAIAAGDDRTGVSIMRLTAGLDSGPVFSRRETPLGPDDDYGTLAARLQEISGDLLVGTLDALPEPVEQDESLVTYAEKISARDRSLDPTRPPDEVERMVRALRPHLGARIPLPDGTFLGVWAARPGGETLAPAGGRVRTEGERLLMDCNGGALELLEIQPPGGRPMPAAAWLRGRPDPALTDFWLDPQLPDRSAEELAELAVREWGSDAEWAPYAAALALRHDRETAERLAAREDPRARAVAAYILGQAGDSADALARMAAAERDPEVLATIAAGFGHLGEPHGTDWLLEAAGHPDPAVRDAVTGALAGRQDPRVVGALIGLSSDPESHVRDWATFALGALCPQDGPDLRDALGARLEDPDPTTRIEAVHGLAVRGDVRGLEAALALLDGPRPEGVWERHALEEAAIRLAALTGDQRLRPHLPDPALYEGTVLETELARALSLPTSK